MQTVRDTAIWYLRHALGSEAVSFFQKHSNQTGIRDGQAFMNTLSEFNPEDYRRLLGTDFDPFYRDAKIPEAVDLLCTKG